MAESRKNTLAGAFSPLLKKKARISEDSPQVLTSNAGNSQLSLTPSQSQSTTPKKIRVEQAFEYSPINRRSNDNVTAAPASSSAHVTTRNQHKSTTINDCIHGNITMDGLCLQIIDTKEFQRLRQLKQLGVCDYVFPGATHTRFTHSIGVSHYAEKVLRALQFNQPYLNITEQDILCVKVAGLCHDLGHGPFSHVYDGVFLARMLSKRVREQSQQTPNTVADSSATNEFHKDMHHVRHEDCSVMIFRHLLKVNGIDPRVYGLTDLDVTFIEEIIRGTAEKDRIGRGHEKFYLYDVVNNSRSGLDVDKLDYFQRDIHYTKVCTGHDEFERLLQYGRVMRAMPVGKKGAEGQSNKANTKNFFPFDSPEEHRSLDARSVSSATPTANITDDCGVMVCYQEKMVGEILDLFRLRFNLHQKAYTHKSVKKVEFMLVDALVAADDVISIPGSITPSHPDGLYKMSECIYDPAALSNLSDSIIYVIESSTSEELRKSREIIEHVRRRDFYMCFGKTVYKRGSKADKMTVEEITEELLEIANSLPSEQPSQLLHSNSNVNIEESDNMDMDGGDYFDDSFNGIQSQDSFAPWLMQHRAKQASSSQNSNNNNEGTIQLLYDDIIVEKMHIHYGMKGENPVNNVRFYPKDVNMHDLTEEKDRAGAYHMKHIAKPIKESTYEHQMPRVFEECAVRLFCRNSAKNDLVRRAYEIWCREHNNSSTPFPSLSQQ